MTSDEKRRRARRSRERGPTKQVAPGDKFTPLNKGFVVRVSFYGDMEGLKKMEVYLRNREPAAIIWSTFFNDKNSEEPLLQADINPSKYEAAKHKANLLKLHIHSRNWRKLPS